MLFRAHFISVQCSSVQCSAVVVLLQPLSLFQPLTVEGGGSEEEKYLCTFLGSLKNTYRLLELIRESKDESL